MDKSLNPAEPLWPQLLRYGLTIVGAGLASRGYVSAADWEVIAGAALALAGPLYRIVMTLRARWS